MIKQSLLLISLDVNLKKILKIPLIYEIIQTLIQMRSASISNESPREIKNVLNSNNGKPKVGCAFIYIHKIHTHIYP